MPIPRNAKPIDILQTYTLMIRKTFCYSIDLRVIARPVFASSPGLLGMEAPQTLDTGGRMKSEMKAPPASFAVDVNEEELTENTRRPTLPSKSRAANALNNTPKRWPLETSIPTRSTQRNPPRKKARRVTKRARVLDAMARPEGASIVEISAMTCWQAHTVRAFVSILAKDKQYTIRSTKNRKGERVYTFREASNN